MRAIIAEDEPVARQAIVDMAVASGVEVLAECKDGAEAIHALQIFRPDVLFLDVQMPGIDGFGVLQGVPADLIPAVIFTTAYDQYAVRAFEHNAVDYLLKPFDEERFRRALARAEMQRANQSDRLELIRRLLAELNQSSTDRSMPQRLIVRSRGKVELVRVDQIDWIEASHNYLKIHVGNEVYHLRESIRDIEAKLEPDRFLRIHRSLIVSVDRIRRLEACGYGEYLVVLQDGKSLSLSRGYREHLDRFLDRIAASADRWLSAEPGSAHENGN